jgi:hypothetical protein
MQWNLKSPPSLTSARWMLALAAGVEALSSSLRFEWLTNVPGELLQPGSTRSAKWAGKGLSNLLQLGVLCFGFLQDGNVGVGALP